MDRIVLTVLRTYGTVVHVPRLSLNSGNHSYYCTSQAAQLKDCAVKAFRRYTNNLAETLSSLKVVK